MSSKIETFFLIINLLLSTTIYFIIETIYPVYTHTSLKYYLKYFNSTFIFAVLLTVFFGGLIQYTETKNLTESKNVLKRTLWFFTGLMMVLSVNVYTNSLIFSAEESTFLFTKLSFKELCLLFSSSEIICMLLFAILFIESYKYVSKEVHTEILLHESTTTFIDKLFNVFTGSLLCYLFGILSFIVYNRLRWFLVFYSFIFSVCLILPCFIIVLNSLVEKHKSREAVFK